MRVQVRDGLPYVTVTLLYNGRQLDLANVLLDTGSAGTLFAADQVLAVGLQYEANDLVHRIHGVGGTEFVFVKRIERLSVGELQVSDFDIEVGAMDYGFAIDGIIGDCSRASEIAIDRASAGVYTTGPHPFSSGEQPMFGPGE